jgi:hypothetical protein
MSLDLLNLTAIGFSIPVPLTTTAFVVFGIARTFKRLDAVSIIERGKLSMEVDAQRQASRSSAKPLSSLTFYLRHRRRGLILIVAMGLMILGVSFPAFLIAPMGDAMKPFAEHLCPVSVVTPRMGTAVDPGVAAQVRTHPSVARVIPAIDVPMRSTSTVSPRAIYRRSSTCTTCRWRTDIYRVPIPTRSHCRRRQH